MNFLNKFLLSFFLLLFSQHLIFSESLDLADVYGKASVKGSRNIKGIISSTFKIKFDSFPNAFNPSIVKADQGYILTFRYLPEPVTKPWISYVGAVMLNDSFQPISEPELLDMRIYGSPTPSQAEDARIFSYNGGYYIVFNDNSGVTNTSSTDRRDIYISKVVYENNHFSVYPPIKLFHPENLTKRCWEKNWSPFVWNGNFLLSYAVNPHEVLLPDLETGICVPCHSTSASIQWKWGQLRGGTPAELVDGEYLAFFHTAQEIASKASNNENMWHYFMGVYTFSANPPFNITKASQYPLNEKSFYNKSENPKRVIYPGGFAISNGNIYLAYGKDDNEIWIAVINKDRLMSTLKQVK